MAQTKLDEFWEALERSTLISEAELRRARDALDGVQNPHDLVRWFAGERLLTEWQVQRLVAGQDAFFLGRYKLLAPLGQGGMGAVFQAEQIPLGRIVAVKIMAERLVCSPAHVARFRREIQAAAALNHPNIVTALDADSAGESHFLVMEYVPGRDLSRILEHSDRQDRALLRSATGSRRSRIQPRRAGIAGRDSTPAFGGPLL